MKLKGKALLVALMAASSGAAARLPASINLPPETINWSWKPPGKTEAVSY